MIKPNHQLLMKSIWLWQSFSNPKKAPPASGVAEPSSAYSIAVKSVYCINHKSIITALPASHSSIV